MSVSNQPKVRSYVNLSEWFALEAPRSPRHHRAGLNRGANRSSESNGFVGVGERHAAQSAPGRSISGSGHPRHAPVVRALLVPIRGQELFQKQSWRSAASRLQIPRGGREDWIDLAQPVDDELLVRPSGSPVRTEVRPCDCNDRGEAGCCWMLSLRSGCCFWPDSRSRTSDSRSPKSQVARATSSRTEPPAPSGASYLAVENSLGGRRPPGSGRGPTGPARSESFPNAIDDSMDLVQRKVDIQG